MEQAVNQFTKGLQNDTHPMVQSNNTLSNALNATFVTMNGNEVVLQNDMGNRRVDNAFLPAGYEPVGIKEYGGIIYVASYNPVTNKSQIGSFPSPERKIGEEIDDLKESFSLEIGDDNSNYKFTTIKEKGIKYLKEDSLLIPLTKSTSIHTGDKFSVYCSNLWNLSQKITNFDNVNKSTKKVLSPKNKQFTLYLGILNSQNEFVDITNSLERWNENKIIEFEDTDSELYKYNRGYFIAKDKPEEIDIKTIDDRKLIQNRLSMPVNTYSYKLIGPLYLKINFNRINSITYNIDGIKNSDRSVTLEVSTYIEYNCPDGLISCGKGDEIYEDYETTIPSEFKFFPFYFGIMNNDNEYEIIETPSESTISREVIYNPNTNLYSVNIVNRYNINPSDYIIKYLIGVPAIINSSEIFIKGLSQEGEIDSRLLGSGSVILQEWNFSNNCEENKFIQGNLRYGFQTYAKIGHTFKDLEISFVKCNDTNNVDNPNETISDISQEIKNGSWIYVSQYLTHGTFEINNNTIDYTGRKLENNTMYNVYIRYKDSFGNSENIIYYNTVQWFITSDIFNNNSESNFNEIKEYIINPKINYTFEPETTIKDYEKSEGELLSFKVQEDYMLKNRISFETKFENKMSFNINKPENIKVESSKKSMKIKFPEDTNIVVTESEGTLTEYDGYERNLDPSSGERTVNEGVPFIYKGSINQFMYAKALTSSQKFTILNNFINFGDYLKLSSKENWFKAPWIGIESYDYYFDFFGLQSSFGFHSANSPTIEEALSNYEDDTHRLKKPATGYTDTQLKDQNNYDVLNNVFNSLSNNQLFIAADSNDWFLDLPYVQDKPEGKRRHCCLVWMQYKSGAENKWMLFCEIIVTKNQDDWDRVDPRINWTDFTEYVKKLNYYSNFNNDTSLIDIYTYDENNKLFIKQFIWNINLEIKYSLNLEISDSLSNKKRRVEFKLNNEVTEENIKYQIQIDSSKQRNNKLFLDYVSKKVDEVTQKTIDSYCIDTKTSGLELGYLYELQNGKLIKIENSKNQNSNIPNFPTVTNIYPEYIIMEEENMPYSRLDLRGVPTIKGLLRYKNYNQDG